ncbi:hypothetical protein F5Y12DRAFT_717119 [Xylaria sp. FL1777]|nr:hypothetical protein F5Y12DRAFT_717119 [Xylaria sp. FL1777]
MTEQPDTKVEKGHDVQSILACDQAQCSLRRLWISPTWYRRAPSPKSYPPISSIPRTSSERLALASPDNPAAAPKTILYLAYGSNLCAETFLGVRGIRPISQINVSAPAFDLSFDLAGIPYNEPCFANTRPRKIPKPPVPPKFPPSYSASSSPPSSPPSSSSSPSPANHDARRPTWSKGLYGVVYEVTPEDYATIIRTEGGGQGYHDILTPCFELPPALHVPEKPPIPELPKPFLAHTLYAPALPALPPPDNPCTSPGKDSNPTNTNSSNDSNNNDNDDGDGGDGDDEGDDDDDDDDPRKQPWFRRLFLPLRRPCADYAQPSARYLKLIRDGAAEHALPDDYQAYLAAGLAAYAMTRWRQHVGRALFLLLAVPGLLLLIGLGQLLADDVGRTPRWLGVAMTVWMNLLWSVYDAVYKPLFGDGERTMSEEDDDDGEVVVEGLEGAGMRMRKSRRRSMFLKDGSGGEKNGLLLVV